MTVLAVPTGWEQDAVTVQYLLGPLLMPPRHTALMELRRLELFVAFAELGTVTAAAEKVRLAQPALSRQLAALEKELEVPLFERSQNRLRLTAAGEAFLPAAQELLAHAEQTRAAARALSEGSLHHLVLAAPSATITELVAPYLSTLPIDAPLIFAREVDTQHAYAALNTGADLAVSPVPPQGSIAQISLGLVPIRAYVPPDHPWAVHGRTRVLLADLVRERLFVLPRTHTSRIELELAVTRAGLSFSDLIECELARVIQAHASAGRGVGIVTDYPRFGLHSVTVAEAAPQGARVLGITLHAAWWPSHFAARKIEVLAHGLGAYFEGTGTTVRDDIGSAQWG